MEIREYDSMDAAFKDMAAEEDRGNRDLAAAQRMVTWGDHWVRFYQPSPGAQLVTIWSRVWTEDEIIKGEWASGAESQAEIDETMAGIRNRHIRGYMFGRCFSTIEPEGELGDTHRYNLWPITQALYEAAQAVQWDHRALNPLSARELIEVYQAYAGHVRQMRERNRQAAKA